jgi:hypothetical protein
MELLNCKKKIKKDYEKLKMMKRNIKVCEGKK